MPTFRRRVSAVFLFYMRYIAALFCIITILICSLGVLSVIGRRIPPFRHSMDLWLKLKPYGPEEWWRDTWECLLSVRGIIRHEPPHAR